VQHAILRGDEVTGATTFQLVAELDAGPVFGVVTEPIAPTDTAGDLLDRLAVSGAQLLVATMDGIESGELVPRPQPPDGVSLAPKISSDDARVRWDQPAPAVSRQVRACTPTPGAWTQLNEARIKLWPFAGPAPDDHDGRPGPGELRVLGSRVLVGTATVPVPLGDVQPHGKRRMPAADWARGLRLDAAGSVLK
jgi:methionyl-tRNA formyltransferase